MANDLNQCNFIGNLGRDPETRHMPSGDAVTNFSIAVGWKSKEKEGTEWVNITAFGKLAEICAQYLKKGSKVFISGRMTTEKYTDKDGVERYSTKIVADRMQMLDGKPASGNESNDDYATAPAGGSARKQAPSFADMGDDPIPF
jgi:single-strand DNA-binding protein